MFSKPKRAIGLDIGTHSVKAVLMSRSGSRLFIDEVGMGKINRLAVNEDPVGAHAEAVQEAILGMPAQQSLVVAALPGQTAVIRYPRLANVGPEMMDLAVQKEAGQSIPYDLNEVYLDWTLLAEGSEAEQNQLKVLLVAAKHEVIDSRLQIMDAAEVQCGVLGVDSLALADAAEACGFLNPGETVAMINIGLSSASIHFVKDGVSNFIRDVSWGARELIQAIAKERRIDLDQAERQLLNIGEELEPESVEVVEPAAPEPMAASLDDPFGEPASMGGASLLDPLDDEMDVLGRPPAPAQGRKGGDTMDLRDVLHAPLARLVSEVRRSFDYYEHQLYEKPVDRIILSGGVGNMPLLRDTFLEELGIETVDIADPTRSSLMLGDEMGITALKELPSAFMVAIGLAARGMADL